MFCLSSKFLYVYFARCTWVFGPSNLPILHFFFYLPFICHSIILLRLLFIYLFTFTGIRIYDISFSISFDIYILHAIILSTILRFPPIYLYVPNYLLLLCFAKNSCLYSSDALIPTPLSHFLSLFFFVLQFIFQFVFYQRNYLCIHLAIYVNYV